jgi:hypothetical protein
MHEPRRIPKSKRKIGLKKVCPLIYTMTDDGLIMLHPNPEFTKEPFPHNPEHQVGTCSLCGEEMSYNVPRLGPDGGFVHFNTNSLNCTKKDES